MTNITGIRPAYRRLTMDMCVTLAQAIGHAKEFAWDSEFTIMSRGQYMRSRYLPAAATDVMDWLLSVYPSWKVSSYGDYPHDVDSETGELTTTDLLISQEVFTVNTYGSSTMIGPLTALLLQPRTMMFLGITGRELRFMAMDESHRVRLECTSTENIDVLFDMVPKTDHKVHMDGVTGRLEIEPLDVASIIAQSQRGHDEMRILTAVTTCGRITKDGEMPNISTLYTALGNIGTILTTNMVEYGFSAKDQLLVFRVINDAVASKSEEVLATAPPVLDESFQIVASIKFDEDSVRYGYFNEKCFEYHLSFEPITG